MFVCIVLQTTVSSLPQIVSSHTNWTLRDQIGFDMSQTQLDTLRKKKVTRYHVCCEQELVYCVCVFLFHSVSLSAMNQRSVRTSFKLSHSINTGCIDFFKQLMEAFRVGKLIKIICRSSSFKESPLVCVELNHARLKNPSMGHHNWLELLMAFQFSFIQEKDRRVLWQFSRRRFNNSHTESLKTIDVCLVSSKCVIGAWRCFQRHGAFGNDVGTSVVWGLKIQQNNSHLVSMSTVSFQNDLQMTSLRDHLDLFLYLYVLVVFWFIISCHVFIAFVTEFHCICNSFCFL